MRVLIAAELEPFLRRETIPTDIEADLASESAPLPGGEYVGVISHVAMRVGAAELDRLPRLRVIANFGVGYDNIDVIAARARGIAVSNTPGVLTGATAELTWALILAVARRVTEGERLVRAGQWSGWTPTQLLGTELEGCWLGIVGAGRIGREVGRRARVFGMRVAYNSRTRHAEWEAEVGAAFLPLEKLLERCDVVSIHASLNAESRALIDGNALARMKDGAVLINTSRGAVVDEDALVRELESGRLRAGLDVYADEPRVPERLCALDNVVLLPHLGSATERTRNAMWRMAWQNLLAGVRGMPVPNAVC
jgi:glyoxylate reductase